MVELSPWHMQINVPKDPGPLRAFERCNRHGTREAAKPITVE
jgi:hypothetical protein